MFKKSLLVLLFVSSNVHAQNLNTPEAHRDISTQLLEKIQQQQGDLRTENAIRNFLERNINKREVFAKDGALTSFSLSGRKVHSMTCKRKLFERFSARDKKQDCQINYISVFCGADRFSQMSQSFTGHSFVSQVSFTLLLKSTGEREVLNYQITDDRSKVPSKSQTQTHESRDLQRWPEECQAFIERNL